MAKKGPKHKTELAAKMTKRTRGNLRRFREFIYATFPHKKRTEQNVAKRLADEVGSESRRNANGKILGAVFASDVNTFHHLSSIHRYGGREAQDELGISWKVIKKIEQKFPDLLLKLGFAKNMCELRKLSEPPFESSNKALKKISGFKTDYPTPEEALYIMVKLSTHINQIWPGHMQEFSTQISLLEKLSRLLSKREKVKLTWTEAVALDDCCDNKGSTGDKWANQLEALIGTIMAPIRRECLGSDQFCMHLHPQTMTLELQNDEDIMCKILGPDGVRTVTWDELESDFKKH